MQTTPSIAQTFKIPDSFPNGVWITSVVLYFAAKKVDELRPVMVDLIPTINGYPSSDAMSLGSSIIRPRDIQASSTSLNPTYAYFGNLVYLSPNIEYAIRVTSNSPDYKLWTSFVGDFRLDNRAVTITQQPNLGAMFKSQNSSTWSPEQLQDLCFTLNRAKFDTSKIGRLKLIDKNWLDGPSLPSNPFKTVAGQPTITVHWPSHGYAVGMKVKFYSSTDNRFASTNSFTVTAVPDSDHFRFDLASNATVTDDVGGSNVYAEKSIQYDTIVCRGVIESVEAGTKVTANIVNAGGNTTLDIVPERYTDLSTVKYLYTSENKTVLNSGSNSLAINIDMSSTSDAESPIVNLEGVNVTLIGNKINNPSVDKLDYDVDGALIVTGSSDISFDSVTNKITLPATTQYQLFKLGAWIQVIDAGGSNNTKKGFISNIDTAANTITVVGDALITQTSRSASIYQYDMYIDETAPYGGSAESKYISKEVKLINAAKNFRIIFEGNIHTSAEIDMYYRIAEGRSVAEDLWVKHPISYKKATNEVDFTEYSYDLPMTQQFDTFQFKFVFRSTTPAVSPKMRKLRIIATA